MKKASKILLTVLLSLFIVFTAGIFIFLKTFDVRRFKPQIITAAGDSLGRRVDFGDILLKLSFKHGIQLRLTDLAIGEHPAFGNGNFLTAQEVNFGVSVADLIFRRQIRILGVEARAPQVTIIRLRDGRINAQFFGAPLAVAVGEKELRQNVTQRPQEKPVSLVAMGVPAIFINRITINKGRVTYIDQSFDPALSLTFQQMNVAVEDFSLVRPFPITISAAFASDVPNITLQGMGELNLSRLSFLLKDARISADLFVLSMDALRRSLPQLQSAPLFDINSGRLTAVIKLLEVGAQGLNALNLDAELKDGKFNMQKIMPGASLALRRIAATVKDFTLNGTCSFKFAAAYLNPEPNITAQGKVRMYVDTQTVELRDVDAKVDLASLSMRELGNAMNAFKDNLPQEMKGQLKVVVDQLTAGPAGPLSLKGEGALTDGFLRIKALVAPLETLEAKFTVSELAIMLADGSFSLGKGKVEFSGDIKDYLGRQDFQARIKTNGVDLSQCIDQSKNPVKAKGLVFAEFQLQGQGFDSNALFSKLNGNGSLEIKDGRLTDINILKMVLAKLSFIPHLAETLEANLPERFKEKLQQKDTIVTAFKATAGINDGKVSLQPMNMEADGFLFQADGAVGFDQSYAFDGSFIIPEDLATRMVAIVPQMAYLKDETEQIRFPLRISGKGASVSFMPDIKQIGATVFENKGRQELEKVLDKVFKNRDTSAQVNTPPAVTGEEDKKKDKQQLIRDIIGTILKK